MNERLVKSWASTIIGSLMIIFAGVLLFVETHVKVSGLQIAGIAIVGILLLFAKDTLIDIVVNWARNKFNNKQ